MQEYTRVFKALADRNRARILKMLEERELCVCQIIAVLGLKQSTVSKHLSVLKNAGLVQDRRDGTWVFYSLSRRRQNDFDQAQLGLMRNWLNEDALVESDRARLEGVLKIDIHELCRR
ncbi:MAG: winged helix-turn-helix transcriptional regulator [Candidatus Hydrogenedentota bacterium]|nr:MAG: winged helix-turn-helix transcriptional regulator [Candidatus Hydrogenedentota bacterium]